MLMVPGESLEKYKNAEYWKNFVNIQPIRTDISKYDDIIYVMDNEGLVSQSVTLSVKMKHTMDVSGFQMNLFLPDGFTISKITRGEGIKGKDDNEEYIYTFNNTEKEDGSRFFLCYSVSNTPMPEGDIEVAKVTVAIHDSISAGEYPITLKAGEMAYGSSNKIVDFVTTTLTVNDYIIGDANGDGIVSVSDITAIGSYLLGGTPSPFNAKAAETNGDGKLSVGDMTTIAEMLLGKTKAGAKALTMDYDNE